MSVLFIVTFPCCLRRTGKKRVRNVKSTWMSRAHQKRQHAGGRSGSSSRCRKKEHNEPKRKQKRRQTNRKCFHERERAKKYIYFASKRRKTAMYNKVSITLSYICARLLFFICHAFATSENSFDGFSFLFVRAISHLCCLCVCVRFAVHAKWQKAKGKD